AVACVRTVPIDEQPCPCPDGYTCCASDNRCLPPGETCNGAGDAGVFPNLPDSGLEPDGRIAVDPVLPVDASPNLRPAGEDVVLFAAWWDFMPGTGNYMLVASWYNGTKQSIFVDSSCAADWWQLRDGAWVLRPSDARCYQSCPADGGQPQGSEDQLLDGGLVSSPFSLCPVTNSNLTELPPGGTMRVSFGIDLAQYGNGIYRLQGMYSLGCSPGSSCASSVQVVGPEVVVSLMAGPAPKGPTAANPGDLHAVCSQDAPCSPDQTAIETFYDDGVTCTCEMRCTPDTDGCPAGAICTHVSDGIGSLCK
ncbi:MAG TPA: hypothetical protein VF518_05240, partial [Polyangia bacterium]